MAKLGYMTSFDDLDEYTAMVFMHIDVELDKLQEKDRKQQARKVKSRKRK